VTDVGRTAGSLAAILKMNQEELRRKLRSDSSFEWIQRKIPPEQTEEIKALHLPGIAFIKENKRFYPNAHLAAHVIGFGRLERR
jgi:cell division protein FtsI (penicillin-binding protein 3)